MKRLNRFDPRRVYPTRSITLLSWSCRASIWNRGALWGLQRKRTERRLLWCYTARDWRRDRKLWRDFPLPVEKKSNLFTFTFCIQILEMYLWFIYKIVCIKPYVPREPRRDPNNRRLYEHSSIWYVSGTTKSQTRNQFRQKCVPIPLGHSDGQRPQYRNLLCIICQGDGCFHKNLNVLFSYLNETKLIKILTCHDVWLTKGCRHVEGQQHHREL